MGPLETPPSMNAFLQGPVAASADAATEAAASAVPAVLRNVLRSIEFIAPSGIRESARHLGEPGVEHLANQVRVGLAPGLLHDLSAEETFDGFGLLLAPLEVLDRLGIRGQGGLDRGDDGV